MHRCIICGNELNGTPLFELENMPASAQDIPTAEECKTEKGVDLKLQQCNKCGLVQFDCQPVDYYKDVIRAGGGTSTMKQLRQTQYAKFIELCNLNGKKIIEVGAGRGEFLSIFSEFDVKAYGIEHKQDLVEIAKDNGLNVFSGFAEDKDSKFEGAPYDAFTSFNFLEHQPDPNGMLSAIYNNLTDDGVGLITVPSLEYILEYDGFYELIRDHLAYYTFDTLRFLLEKNGFELIQKEMVNRDTLSVIVRKKAKIDVSKIKESYNSISKEINDYVKSYFEKGEKVAIWGASHQGFTIASTTQMRGKIEYIIDSASFKQGKYSPSSHIPIVSPDYFFENPVNVIIIIAPGYTEEIRDIIKSRFGKDVKISILKSNHLESL